MNHDEAVETISYNSNLIEALWGKKMQLAIFFTAPFQGGILEIVHGAIHIRCVFFNETEMIDALGELL